MKRWRRMVALGVLGLISAWLTGCSRQPPPESNASANSGRLPFERVSERGGISPTAGFAFDGIPAGTQFTVRLQMALSSADSRAGDSFQAVLDEPLVIARKTIAPRGTPVTGSVLAARASEGLTDPGYLRLTLASIVMNGKSVPLQTSSIFAKGGFYQRRKPTPIRSTEPDGKASAVEPALGDGNPTAINPVQGNPHQGNRSQGNPGQGDVRFSTGRRLNFRLAQPVHPSG
jgi:hypothetical protein